MAIDLVCFSDRGEALGRTLRERFDEEGAAATLTRCGETAAGPTLAAWTARQVADTDGLVFIGAVGIAVRAVAAHLESKLTDPPVVAVDDQARFAVALLSGHIGGANALAERIARLCGATPVVTTATDGACRFAVDAWAAERGLAIANPGRIKRVAARTLSGEAIRFYSPFPAPTPPPGWKAVPEAAAADVVIDIRQPDSDSALWLVPRIAALGIGCRRGTPAATLEAAAAAFLARHGVPMSAVATLCSIDLKADEPGLQALAAAWGIDLTIFAADQLAAVDGDFPDSATVRAAAGVGSVCDRAARLGGGPLIAGKTIVGGVALALSARPYSVPFPEPPGTAEKTGKVYVVGIGPGDAGTMTAAAAAALAEAEVLCGYTAYIDLVAPRYPGKRVIATGMTGEARRCRAALAEAAAGRTVALISSGDAGVYGMAGLVHELAPDFPPLDIEVVPGVTAALAGAALLGAPLMHDFAVVSLSDRLTPWETIAARLRAAAAADLVICLYNPASRGRPDALSRACDIVLAARRPDTVCGWVRNAGRAGQSRAVLTLAELRDHPADMSTTVFIGSSATRIMGGKMVTPRGYPEARP